MVTTAKINFDFLPKETQNLWINRAITVKDNDYTKDYIHLNVYNLAELLYNRSTTNAEN